MNTRASTTLKKGRKTKGRRKPQARKGWRQKFLKALRKWGNVNDAAHFARVERTATYRARDNDLKFAAAWDEAMAEACDVLESEARRRAVDGVLEPVGFYRGVAADHIQRYSDVLLIFLLKAHDPKRFRDNYSVEVTGKGGGPVQENVTSLTDAELEFIAAGGSLRGARAASRSQKSD